MASNHTEHYGLNQWERTDKVIMEDFNEDNAKIDAAIKAEADARAAELAAQAGALEAEVQARTALASSLTSSVAKAGNCQICTSSYTGTGTYGADVSKKFTFPYKPMLVFVTSEGGTNIHMLQGQTTTSYPTSSPPAYIIRVTWSGNSVSWYGNHVHSQMNDEGATYYVVALCSKN